ncbi:MAG TPA: hypothetical protein VGV37_14475 [Aliidongia sp.]|uniref:hypothetical protein n=1 Tax=Aliidongia sp. TaxID=1914230 RepID=UPI002DDD49D4|nr:hypothetical protein [Aliidongia sp.]HEV2675747.1 hypothetical protein [Aliidongia sp.]
MKTRILGIAIAVVLAGAAVAQTTSRPGEVAPIGTTPTPSRNDTGPGVNSTGATGSVTHVGPDGIPAKDKVTPPPYAVPAQPGAQSGDNGSTHGKTVGD